MTAFEKAFNAAPEETTKQVRLALKSSMSKVLEDAKSTHRFTTRSGSLVKSMFMEVKFNEKSILGRVVLPDAGSKLGVEYGKYIHDGFDKWSADPFLEKAFDKNKTKINERLNKAIELGLKGLK